jgi:uncharacterized protein with von Willebrand factor type A (vWA) domain
MTVAEARVRDVTEVLMGFARTLRQAGVPATPDRVQAMVAALGHLDVLDPASVYWAGRCTLCGEPDDLRIYDAAFAAYFAGEQPRRPGASAPPGRQRLSSAALLGGSVTGDGEPHVSRVATVASGSEVLRHRDVRRLSAAERDELRAMVALLAPEAATRRSRRHRPSRRGRVDAPRTVRATLRHAGETTRLARRAAKRRPRRLVLLVDVSGSMGPYADTLLRFAHAAVRRRPAATEVFTLGTRLTRITRELRQREPDAALAAAGKAIPDWSGGTRLGEALKAFADRWGQRGVARGAVLVLFSDGWERGDPSLLASQVARLRRLTRRLVWVNPHAGHDGFAPVAGGMAAALPYVDDLLAGHSLAALERLVEVVRDA